MKTCTHCKETSDVSNFYKRTDTGKLKARCKACECLYSRKRRYKITLQEAEDYIKTPNCECCGKKLANKRSTYIDHCYDTGKIRGILCMSCNSGLGFFGDKLEGLLKAVDYLKKFNTNINN